MLGGELPEEEFKDIKKRFQEVKRLRIVFSQLEYCLETLEWKAVKNKHKELREDFQKTYAKVNQVESQFELNQREQKSGDISSDQFEKKLKELTEEVSTCDLELDSLKTKLLVFIDEIKEYSKENGKIEEGQKVLEELKEMFNILTSEENYTKHPQKAPEVPKEITSKPNIPKIGTVLRIIAILLVLFFIFVGTAMYYERSHPINQTLAPVKSDDVIVSVPPITVKEFDEQNISVNVKNNATESIDSIKVTSFDPFSVLSSGNPNISAKKTNPPSVSINVKIKAPGFKQVNESTTMTLLYASGKDDNGDTVTSAQKVQVKTTVLPNVSLQFVGFVKGIQNITEDEVTTWTIGKGENVTITFSIKNEGETTIDKDALSVLVDLTDERIGNNKNFILPEGPINHWGTSYTKGVEIPISKDAPNGETHVVVKLFAGDKVLDSKTLLLKIRL